MARRFDRLGWAMDQPDLTPTQRFVLVILADMANEIGECWPSRRTISERTGYGDTTVKEALRALRDDEVVVARPRFDASGRQTSNIYVLCLEGRGRVASPPSVDADYGLEGAADDRGGGASRPHVEPTKGTSSKKTNSLTTSTSRSSRPARRVRDEDAEWADPARAALGETKEADEPEDDHPRRRRQQGPDTAWGLNGYYRDKVFHAGEGFLGNTNDGALRKFFAAAKRSGITADTVRAMIDVFVADERLFTKAKAARWRVFIANAENLRQRVTQAQHEATKWDGAEDDDTGIPQHLLDEILAEAG